MSAEVVLKQFTARDMVSRWDVVAVYLQAMSTTAASFLDALQDKGDPGGRRQ